MLDSRDINDLHPTLQRGAKELIKKMEAKGYKVGISSTYRDNEKQTQLYNQGRTTPGKVVTKAKVTTSSILGFIYISILQST